METKIVVTDRKGPEKEAGSATATQPAATSLSEAVQNTTWKNMPDDACYERGYRHGGINE
jgi:hypothetical protein